MKSTKNKLLKSLQSVQRLNVKIDISFWVMIPYSEHISYIINNIVYKPVSYRFLCFAVIIVTDSNKIVEYQTNPELAKLNKKK